ncbi:hypothetical protein Pan44_22210 [Caulifigura coniformis]|uniref:Uncharacterized protein n=1 Tax=Caulifigura coniformis TaxID=2527983 RepID=A0A517SDI6_9PLAN|nr:hypothetical protein Pan44_22210 [Caulifigura coniformis]
MTAMLRIESADMFYLVYPSWLSVGLPWQDIERAAASSESTKRFTRVGTHIEAEAWSGTLGGGIVRIPCEMGPQLSSLLRVGIDTGHRSNPGLVDPVVGDAHTLRTHVLRMYAIPSPSIIRPRHVEYRCPVSPEHCSAAGENVYWLMTFPRGTKKVPSGDVMSSIGVPFGLHMEPVTPPAALNTEVDAWCSDHYDRHWFGVVGASRDLMWNYAVAVYCGLSLAATYRRLQAIHVVAQFENPFNCRCRWNERHR